MSVRWITWAWDQECSNAGEKLTLIALADHAGEDGTCWPSSGRLCEKTGQGRSTIQRQLQRLADAGVISRETRYREDGSQTSSLVRLGTPPSQSGTPPCLTRDTGGVSPVTPLYEPSLEPSDEPSPSSRGSDEDFELFWVTYGRTGPKKVARQCWDKAVKKAGGPAPIQAGLEKWVAYWKRPNAASVKWPQGWLNEERWKDDPPGALNGKKQSEDYYDPDTGAWMAAETRPNWR